MKYCMLALIFMIATSICSNAYGQEPDSTTLFFLLGMIHDDEYIGRSSISKGDSLVEHFYSHESSNAAIFEKSINKMKSELGSLESVRIDTLDYGDIAFYSTDIAKALDSCAALETVSDGVKIRRSLKLKPDLIRRACEHENYAFAFLRGVYLRNARSKASQKRAPRMQTQLSFSNSFYKAALTESLLQQFGCKDLEVIHKRDGAPYVIEIYFSPSDVILSEVILKALAEYFSYPRSQ
jgi:hypothetical protein